MLHATTSNAQQYYVYNAHNHHVGPVTAELIARGVLAGKVPEDAFVAPVGANNWVPIRTVAEIEDAVRAARATTSSVRPSASGIPAEPSKVEAKAEKAKEETKPVLDPRMKLLPIALFGGFALLGMIETVIMLVIR